jgi:hypothetical protein
VATTDAICFLKHRLQVPLTPSFLLFFVQDLLNYVTQFLGLDPTTAKNERVHKLCNDIAAFQRGESLFNQEGADDLNQQQQPPKQQQLPMDYGSSTASVVKRDLKEKKQQQQKSYKQKEKAPRRVLQKPTPPPNQQPTLLSVSNTRTEQPGSVDNVVVSATVEDKDETKQPFAAATNESSTTQLLVPESNDGTTLQPPRRGRRTNPVCDCFGTFHKALTNCLTCGRIACEPETYDYCPFCGYLLEPVQKPTSSGDAYVAVVKLDHTHTMFACVSMVVNVRENVMLIFLFFFSFIAKQRSRLGMGSQRAFTSVRTRVCVADRCD